MQLHELILNTHPQAANTALTQECVETNGKSKVSIRDDNSDTGMPKYLDKSASAIIDNIESLSHIGQSHDRYEPNRQLLDDVTVRTINLSPLVCNHNFNKM